MRIKSRWQFETNCMECTVIGSVQKDEIIHSFILQQILLSKAIEIMEIAEKDFKAIIMAKDPKAVVPKNTVSVSFSLMFESMEKVQKFISHLKN